MRYIEFLLEISKRTVSFHLYVTVHASTAQHTLQITRALRNIRYSSREHCATYVTVNASTAQHTLQLTRALRNMRYSSRKHCSIYVPADASSLTHVTVEASSEVVTRAKVSASVKPAAATSTRSRSVSWLIANCTNTHASVYPG